MHRLPRLNRHLSLLRHAWLIVWNLALLALLLAPVVALYKAGWLAVAFLLVLGFGMFLVRHPAFLLGMWVGRDRD